ncbi:hypothetical protein [Microbacterium sp. Leaf320]|uniref:hypothetical protein n=1 Tax=Microbacterium sp. Leaf320 TaxID=1736334 RepID=UPI0006FB14F7|nr:hypothetical protein [Microbacterium sp. Leaf320]KQQ68706.1 hypothetical protein ASF63_01550 [Microbacterium sp. Leaf320]
MDDCETCDSAGVPGIGTLPWDIGATTEALIRRVDSGRMRELRHDVPLEDMIALLESDLKYTIVSFVECLDCGRVLFWGLCIRGNPILRHADRTEIDRRRWSEVPPRRRWARS